MFAITSIFMVCESGVWEHVDGSQNEDECDTALHESAPSEGCICVCETGYYLTPTNTCENPCPGGTYISISGDSCVSACAGSLIDSDGLRCVNVCDTGESVSLDGLRCGECTGNTVSQVVESVARCVCAVWYPAKNGDESDCTDDCGAGKVVSLDGLRCIADAECTTNAEISSTERKCICKPGFPQVNLEGTACKDTCYAPNFLSLDGLECVSECDSASLHIASQETPARKCICAVGFPQRAADQKSCSDQCENGGFVSLDGLECVAKCPGGYLSSSGRACVSSCGAGEVVDLLGLFCAASASYDCVGRGGSVEGGACRCDGNVSLGGAATLSAAFSSAECLGSCPADTFFLSGGLEYGAGAFEPHGAPPSWCVVSCVFSLEGHAVVGASLLAGPVWSKYPWCVSSVQCASDVGGVEDSGAAPTYLVCKCPETMAFDPAPFPGRCVSGCGLLSAGFSGSLGGGFFCGVLPECAEGFPAADLSGCVAACSGEGRPEVWALNKTRCISESNCTGSLFAVGEVFGMRLCVCPGEKRAVAASGTECVAECGAGEALLVGVGVCVACAAENCPECAAHAAPFPPAPELAGRECKCDARNPQEIWLHSQLEAECIEHCDPGYMRAPDWSGCVDTCPEGTSPSQDGSACECPPGKFISASGACAACGPGELVSYSAPLPGKEFSAAPHCVTECEAGEVVDISGLYCVPETLYGCTGRGGSVQFSGTPAEQRCVCGDGQFWMPTDQETLRDGPFDVWLAGRCVSRCEGGWLGASKGLKVNGAEPARKMAWCVPECSFGSEMGVFGGAVTLGGSARSYVEFWGAFCLLVGECEGTMSPDGMFCVPQVVAGMSWDEVQRKWTPPEIAADFTSASGCAAGKRRVFGAVSLQIRVGWNDLETKQILLETCYQGADIYCDEQTQVLSLDLMCIDNCLSGQILTLEGQCVPEALYQCGAAGSNTVEVEGNAQGLRASQRQLRCRCTQGQGIPTSRRLECGTECGLGETLNISTGTCIQLAGCPDTMDIATTTVRLNETELPEHQAKAEISACGCNPDNHYLDYPRLQCVTKCPDTYWLAVNLTRCFPTCHESAVQAPAHLLPNGETGPACICYAKRELINDVCACDTTKYPEINGVCMPDCGSEYFKLQDGACVFDKTAVCGTQ